MSRRIDHNAAKFRKLAPRPLISNGELKEYKRGARFLAERIRKGHKSSTAHLHGKVRQWTPEQVAEWAKANGVPVVNKDRLPWE